MLWQIVSLSGLCCCLFLTTDCTPPCNDTVLFSLPRLWNPSWTSMTSFRRCTWWPPCQTYTTFLVRLNAVQSLLGLLGHDNTDILSRSVLSRKADGCGGGVLFTLLSCLSADVCCHVWWSISILIISLLKHTLLFFYSFGSLVFNLLINLGQP